MKDCTAVMLVNRDFDSAIALTKEDVAGFRLGWNALRRSAGGGAEVCQYYVLPDEEEEVKALPADEYEHITQETVDQMMAAHQASLDSQLLAKGAPCDGFCQGNELGDCSHARRP